MKNGSLTLLYHTAETWITEDVKVLRINAELTFGQRPSNKRGVFCNGRKVTENVVRGHRVTHQHKGFKDLAERDVKTPQSLKFQVQSYPTNSSTARLNLTKHTKSLQFSAMTAETRAMMTTSVYCGLLTTAYKALCDCTLPSITAV